MDAGEYGGSISCYDQRTRQTRNVSVYPYNPSGHGAEDLKYRFQWTAPILVSAHDRALYSSGFFRSVAKIPRRKCLCGTILQLPRFKPQKLHGRRQFEVKSEDPPKACKPCRMTSFQK